jgi:hypothetical protein
LQDFDQVSAIELPPEILIPNQNFLLNFAPS